MITKTFEELVSSIDNWTQYGPGYTTEDIIKLLKQIRLSTLQECSKKTKLCLRIYYEFSESTESDLGQEITTEKQKEYIGIKKDSILKLDLNSIEIDE